MGREFNTLAQLRTETKPKHAKIVTGYGSDLTNDLTAEGRGKRKFLTVQMVIAMVDLSTKNEAMKKGLWNTFHCQRQLTSADGVVYGNYCKNRICTVCQSIRKAVIMNKYYPELSAWHDAQFVTLTVKSCSAKRLGIMMDKMIEGIQIIQERQRKRHERGKGIKLIGVRSLECNFNPIKRTYNPHFHLIVKDKQCAHILKQEWLKLWTTKHAAPWCQDIQPISNLASSMIEIIKYGSKIFTEPDLNKKKKDATSPKIYTKALYNILCAMKGHRLFEKFGFKSTHAPREPRGAQIIVDFDEWKYIPKKRDWVNQLTGEFLTKYVPDLNLLHLLDGQIDFTLE